MLGGNVTISAGGDIKNLAVSLPTTWYLTNANTGNPTVNTVGGGNLTVSAGGNILSGDYFVAKGTGTLTAGGLIGSGGLAVVVPDTAGQISEVSTLLAVQVRCVQRERPRRCGLRWDFRSVLYPGEHAKRTMACAQTLRTIRLPRPSTYFRPRGT